MAEEIETKVEEEIQEPVDDIQRLINAASKENVEKEVEGKEVEGKNPFKEEIEKLKKDLKIAKDGQSGSAKEAARLTAEIKLLKEALSEKKEEKPKNIFEALGINQEDAILDLNDINNPDSATSKVLSTLIAAGAQAQVKRILGERDKLSSQEAQKNDFDKQRMELMQELEMTEDEFNDWFEKIKDQPVSLKQIYSITNPEYFAKQVRENELNEKRKQKRTVSDLHTPLATRTPSQNSDFDEASLLGFLSNSGGIEGL